MGHIDRELLSATVLVLEGFTGWTLFTPEIHVPFLHTPSLTNRSLLISFLTLSAVAAAACLGSLECSTGWSCG